MFSVLGERVRHLFAGTPRVGQRFGLLAGPAINGVSCGEHPGGVHYYEVLPGIHLLQISWQRTRWNWYPGPPLDGKPAGILTEGTTGLRVDLEPGKRYGLEITPTEYGAPVLDLKEL